MQHTRIQDVPKTGPETHDSRLLSNVNRFSIFSSRFHESLFFFEKVWGLRPRYDWVSDVYSGMFVSYAQPATATLLHFPYDVSNR